MAYLETIIGLSVKEILEVFVALMGFILVYFSWKTYLNLKSEKSLFAGSFKLINFGFLAFALSMLFELVDSFYLKGIFDNLQLISGIIAFVLLFLGFRKGFQVNRRGENA